MIKAFMDDIFTHQTFFIHIKVMKYFLTPKSLFKSLNLFQLCSKFVVFISTSPPPKTSHIVDRAIKRIAVIFFLGIVQQEFQILLL